jgi:lipopolysaccharide biosynthesis glycosyltransferase
MLHSVLSHSRDRPVHIHYLHGTDLPGRWAEPLAEMVRAESGTLSFHEVPADWIKGLPVGRYTGTTWYRSFIPEILPHVDRILYMDIDTIVVDSLEPLWQVDLAGLYVAAVTNVLPPEGFERPEALGLDGPHAYFNTGVLLLNLGEMRRDRCTAAILEFGRSHELLWPDQDALNVVLGSRRLPLHPRWNCTNSLFSFEWSEDVFGRQAVEEARRHPAIRHFEGPPRCKPWHFLCEMPFRERYFEHRGCTPWPTCEIDGASPRNRAKRVIRDLLRVEPAKWDRDRLAPQPRWKRIGRS